MLATCCLALFLVGLDTTIVDVALPTIRADLDVAPTALPWVVDAYTLVLGVGFGLANAPITTTAVGSLPPTPSRGLGAVVLTCGVVVAGLASVLPRTRGRGA